METYCAWREANYKNVEPESVDPAWKAHVRCCQACRDFEFEMSDFAFGISKTEPTLDPELAAVIQAMPFVDAIDMMDIIYDMPGDEIDLYPLVKNFTFSEVLKLRNVLIGARIATMGDSGKKLAIVIDKERLREALEELHQG